MIAGQVCHPAKQTASFEPAAWTGCDINQTNSGSHPHQFLKSDINSCVLIVVHPPASEKCHPVLFPIPATQLYNLLKNGPPVPVMEEKQTARSIVIVYRHQRRCYGQTISRRACHKSSNCCIVGRVNLFQHIFVNGYSSFPCCGFISCTRIFDIDNETPFNSTKTHIQTIKLVIRPRLRKSNDRASKSRKQF